MGLGNRNARRHDTARTAGVNPADYWDFKPGQTVLTCDGFLGKVEAVHDGPLSGTEEYEVVLHNGLGGGIYRAAQLTAAVDRTAATENTAARDYPELAEILAERPDPGKYPSSTLGLVASRLEQSQTGGAPGTCANGHLTWGGLCTSCRNADADSNSMVVNPGDHRPQDVEKTATSNEARDWNDAGAHEDMEGDSYVNPPYAKEGVAHTATYENLSNDELGEQIRHLTGSDPVSERARHELMAEIRHRGLNVGDVVVPHPPAPQPKQGSLDEDTEDWYDDEPDVDERETTCPLCGNNRRSDGSHPYNGVGTDEECPNGRGMHQRIEDRFEGLNPDRYCGDNCRSNHASDIEIGLNDPAELRDQSQKADEHKVCRNCGTPLMGSVGDQINGIGSPVEHAFLKSNPTGPTKYSALDNAYVVLAEAARDSEMRFHLTAAWRDVRDKAKRIRTEGNVHITEAKNGFVVAQVKGDHGTYESVLMRFPGTQKVAQWDCGCKWAKYHWGAPDDHSRFAGRMCSHALALNFEAQSRGMFGRDIGTDNGVPRWLTKGDMDRVSSLEVLPIQVLANHLVETGEDRSDVALLVRVQASVNSPFGEPTPNRITPEPGPTKPKDPSDNPASAGFLTSADPEAWGQSNPSALDKMGSLDDEAMFEPIITTAGPAIALIPELLGGAEIAGGAAAEGGAAGLGEAAGAGEVGGGSSVMDTLKGMPRPHQNQHGQQGNPSTSTPKPSYGENDAYGNASANDLAQRRNQATLHDEPEPALPSTDGATEDPEDIFGPSVPGRTWSGYAGDPDPDPKTAAGVPTGVGYAMPSDVSASSGGVDGSGGVGPGIGLKDVDDDALSPTDTSIQTVGAVGGVADIVAEFQRTAGAAALEAGPATEDNAEIAAAAREHLQKSAMADFSAAEQQDLINERAEGGASNLDRLQIEGTHYEALESALARDDEDEGWMG